MRVLRFAMPPVAWLSSPRAARLATAVAIATLLLVARAPGAQAQPVDGDRVPPRIVQLAPVDLDPSALPEGTTSLEVLVLVERDGAAVLDGCDAPSVACVAIADALARSAFEPARIEGQPVRARVRIQLSLASPEPVAGAPPESTSEPSAEVATESIPPSADDASAAPSTPPEGPEPTAPDPASPPAFRAEGRVPRVPAGVRRFELAEIRDVPGAFGDPLRAIETLPGVVAPIVGLPFYYIRGGPPTGNLYTYDEIPLPILFHLVIGPSVIHPRMLGPLRLHAGAAPARYGRFTGGVVAGEGPGEGSIARPESEVELRLLDVNGYVAAPLAGGGDVRAAMRLGWPGVVASLAVPRLEVFYGDYQLRTTHPTEEGELSVVALGSYDRLALPAGQDSANLTEIQFHRLEVRYAQVAGEVTLGVALRLAYDRAQTDVGPPGAASTDSEDSGLLVRAESGSGGPRLWLDWQRDWVRVRVGGDFLALFGRPEISRAPELTAHHTRSIAGAYLETILAPHPSLTLDLGARVDAWMSGGSIEVAAAPRARVAWRPVPELELHVAAGMAQQPAVPTLAVPGFADLAVPRGIQQSLQAELGSTVRYGSFEAELQLFAHRYENQIHAGPYLASLAASELCRGVGSEPCERYEGGTDVHAWGGELFLRVAPRERLSGWISYTLAWAESEAVLGAPYRPEFDVRHSLSAVARWDVGGGFSLGGRVMLRSSGPATPRMRQPDGASTVVGEAREQDAFFRADAQIAYAWDAGWARLRLSLEWMNLTLAGQPSGIACTESDDGTSACRQSFGPPIFAPNLGLRAEM